MILVAFGYQRSRFGRQLRATREDPAAAQAAGIDVHRQRLWAFVLSGALCGFAGGMLVHLLESINVDQVYLDLTFLTLAMLVVGGTGSLFGAVLGGLAVGLVNILLSDLERKWQIGGASILPGGSSLVGVAIVMLVVLLIRPAGVTGGREFELGPWQRLWARRPRPSSAAAD